MHQGDLAGLLEDKAAHEAAPPFPPTVMVQVVVRLIPSHRLMPAAMELPPLLSASFPCSEDLGEAADPSVVALPEALEGEAGERSSSPPHRVLP